MIGKPQRHNPEYIRQLSNKVYRIRLGERDTASMIEKDKDQGQKLHTRSEAYDPMSRAYCEALDISLETQNQSTGV